MKFFLLIFLCTTALHAIDPKIDFTLAKTHIDQKFAEAIVETYPYPHLVIEDILPDSLYQQIQYYWPNSKAFDHQCQTNRHLYITQGCVDLHPLNADEKLFWRIFGEVIGDYIKINIQKKLLPYLHWKFPHLSEKEIEDLKSGIRFFNSRQDSLMEHHFGYRIGPHIDQGYLLGTGLLYCPKDKLHKHLATELYVTLNGEYPVFGSYSDPNNIKIVKSIPYLPNTLFVMLENPKQLHGSALHNDRNYIRKMYGLFVHLAPDISEKYYGGYPFYYTQDWIYYTWEPRHMRFKPFEP